MSSTQRSPTSLSRSSIVSKVCVGERLVDECPKMLGGLQFGAVGRLENEPGPFGHDQIFWCRFRSIWRSPRGWPLLEQAGLQRAKPSGAGERLSAINFASATPSKIRGRAELGLHLRLNTAGHREETPPSAAVDLLKGFAPAIDEVAHQRAAVLAADPARVRQAVDTRQVRAGGAVEVEQVLPPDIIGFYVPLPVID
jgi:hypothetical protein